MFGAGKSQGRSGSFFFFSHNKRFIVKTIPKNELNTLNKILPDYAKHLHENPKSLLARIYGVYTFKIEGIKAVHLILMENVIQNKKNEVNMFCN
jgi:hypothetical protein